MNELFSPPHRSWRRKFRDAGRGLAWAIRTQSSCHVHAVATLAVLLLSAFLHLAPWQWCVILLAIGGVWTSELLNTSIEVLAREVDRSYNARLGLALDIASGAVLCFSSVAVMLGAIVLGPELWRLLIGLFVTSSG